MTLELAIVLPTLNERDNIAPLIKRIDASLPDTRWEVIVVDDNSEDGTARLVRELARSDPRIRIIQRFGRRGLASAAIEGICATAAPYVAIMDADHQHDPALLPRMLAAVRDDGCEVAVASRYVPGGDAEGLEGSRRARASSFGTRLARRLTGVELYDPLSGYFLLQTQRARQLVPRLSGIGFKLLLDLLAAARPPLRAREFPLRLAPRRAGASKLDRAVALDYLAGIYERIFGRVIPTRFALFGTVGAIGILIHIAVLAALHRLAGEAFAPSQALATLTAMSFNFWLNNLFTYRDQRLRGTRALLRGWLGFCAACAVGAVANVAVAALIEARGVYWILAALAGILVGSLWNYALSGRFVWGRF